MLVHEAIHKFYSKYETMSLDDKLLKHNSICKFFRKLPLEFNDKRTTLCGTVYQYKYCYTTTEQKNNGKVKYYFKGEYLKAKFLPGYKEWTEVLEHTILIEYNTTTKLFQVYEFTND